MTFLRWLGFVRRDPNPYGHVSENWLQAARAKLRDPYR